MYNKLFEMKFFTLVTLVACFVVDSKLGIIASTVHPPQTLSCPQFSLLHGSVNQSLQSPQIAYLKCYEPYVLIGAKRIVCDDERGEWKPNFSVCGRKDCPRLSGVPHGSVYIEEYEASARVVCDTNFKLIGPAFLYCTDKSQWNGTLAQCMVNDAERFNPCHFEVDDYKTHQCHWFSKPSTLYRWIRYIPKEESGWAAEDLFSEMYNIPPFNSTIMKGNHGVVLLLAGRPYRSRMNAEVEGRTNNTEAKFISPLLPATAETNEQLCFVFYSYIDRIDSSVTLKVLINEDIVWQYNKHAIYTYWMRHVIDLRNQSKPFRVSLTAVTGEGRPFQVVPGIAVDDLSLVRGDKCDFNNSQSSINETTTAETTPFPTVDEHDAREHDFSFPSSITSRTNISSSAYNISTTDFGALLTKTNPTTTLPKTSPAYYITVKGPIAKDTADLWHRLFSKPSYSTTRATVSPIMVTTRHGMNIPTTDKSVDGHLFSSSHQIPEQINATTKAATTELTMTNKLNMSDGTKESANGTDHFYLYHDYNDEYDYDYVDQNVELSGTTSIADEDVAEMKESEKIHHGLFITILVASMIVILLAIATIFATRIWARFRRDMLLEDRVHFLTAEANSDEEFTHQGIDLGRVSIIRHR